MKRLALTCMMAIVAAATIGAQTETPKKDAPRQSAAKKAAPKKGAAKKRAADKAKISLADARSRIDKAIESPDVMAEIVSCLSAEDQRQFLADVNKAIGDLPASLEEKSAKYLSLNLAAVRNAAPGNVAAMLAETYATVPPEALTVINEQFAADLLSRSANPDNTYTDEQFTRIAVETMKVINKRTSETDNGSTRSAFAILMFLRASNGSPADLSDKLIDTLEHEDARQMARDEWIPSALGKDGREQGYEPLLASADAGRRPDLDFVLVIAGPQYTESVLQDLFGKNTDEMSFINTRSPVLDAVENPIVHQIPTMGGDVFGLDIVMPADGNPDLEPLPEPEEEQPKEEPQAYWGQTINWEENGACAPIDIRDLPRNFLRNK